MLLLNKALMDIDRLLLQWNDNNNSNNNSNNNNKVLRQLNFEITEYDAVRRN